jgi:DNA gyrase subunit A
MNQQIIDVPVADSMRRNFLDYAMSVITDRAIPDVRDGLKPVHRRILYMMHEMKLTNDRPFKKSAEVVGSVMGVLHPHGDVAIYEAAVLMAQPWSLLHPLIDPQGNFGSMDGDSPAAMRYTEMRLAKIASHFFETMGKDVVDTRPNYNASVDEPTVLPVTYPNILVNGTYGIAVGMATNMPPHNLGEVIDAFLAYVDDPTISVRDIVRIMPAPDFPTGGIVHGLDGYVAALEEGRGAVRLRGTWHEETRKGGGVRLVIDELPWRVNKAELIIKIADLVREKAIDDITRLDDESSGRTKASSGGSNQVRIVMDLAKGASAEVLFNQLVALTNLEVTIPYNAVLLIGQQPRQMGIREVFQHFLEFRLDVIVRAARFDLAKAEERLHVLEGFLAALDLLDETIATIRASSNPDIANAALCTLLAIDPSQARAILELRLSKLTNLEIEAIRAEREQMRLNVEDLKDIVASRARQITIVREDCIAVQNKFAQPRRTTISQDLSAITREDLVEREPVVIPITANGYIKRIPVAQINQQNRGTRGKSWMNVGDDDVVKCLLSASTHDYLLSFNDSGTLFACKVHAVPEAAGNNTKGRHIKNVLDGLEGAVINVMSVPTFSDDAFLVTVSARGSIKRTALTAYEGATRRGGIKGVKIDEGDRIVAVDVCRQHDHIVLVSSGGRAIRFEANDQQMRPMGRDTVGTRGMRLEADEEIVGMAVLYGNGEPLSTIDVQQTAADGSVTTSTQLDTSAMDQGKFLFCVGSRGVGKKSKLSEFPVQARAGKGVGCFNINKKTGPLVRALLVTESGDLIMTTQRGVTNRIRIDAVRTAGRVTAGSYLMKPDDGDSIVAVSPVVRAEEEV